MKVRGWRRRGGRLNITEIRYLVVRLFHDWVKLPRNDIHDLKFLGCNCVPWSRHREKGLYVPQMSWIRSPGWPKNQFSNKKFSSMG